MEEDTLEFILPNNEITMAFLKLHNKEKFKCLELGLRFLSFGTQKQQYWNNSQWEKKISRLQNDLDLEKERRREMLELHNNEKRLLSEQIRATEDCRWKPQITTLTTKNNTLEEKMNQMMNNYIELHKKLTDEWTTKMGTREIFYENKINTIQNKFDVLQKDYMTSLEKSQNSTILGQVGESVTYEGLNRLFPKAEIEDCHQTKGRGDFILHENDFVMMIETKNYTKNVTKPEIQKFYRDFDQNSDFKCAILVSLKSGICSRPDFHLEVRNNKPILFLHNVCKNMDNLLLAVRFFKLILHTDHIDLTNKEIVGKLQILTPAIKRNWNSMKQNLQQFNQSMNKLIEEQEQYIKEIFKLLVIKY